MAELEWPSADRRALPRGVHKPVARQQVVAQVPAVLLAVVAYRRQVQVPA